MDILLNPETHDALFVNGSCHMTTSLGESVAQRLKVTLLTFRGEWFLDTTYGVPYRESVFGKGRVKSVVDAVFVDIIKQDPDVIEIVEFNSTLTYARDYTIEFTVRVTDGTVTDSIEVVI